MGVGYEHRIRACNVEFTETLGPDEDTSVARYACLLVHEATHGVIESRGVTISKENQIRIERLCMTEQNRFATRLTAADPERFPRELLHLDFRAGYWHWEWTANPWKKVLSFLSRWFADR